jgi:hypothetical protein
MSKEITKNGDERTVYSWPSGRDTEVRASWSSFKGKRYAHVRTYVADENDEMHATRKGVAVPVDSLHHLEEAVEKLREAA